MSDCLVSFPVDYVPLIVGIRNYPICHFVLRTRYQGTPVRNCNMTLQQTSFVAETLLYTKYLVQCLVPRAGPLGSISVLHARSDTTRSPTRTLALTLTLSQPFGGLKVGGGGRAARQRVLVALFQNKPVSVERPASTNQAVILRDFVLNMVLQLSQYIPGTR